MSRTALPLLAAICLLLSGCERLFKHTVSRSWEMTDALRLSHPAVDPASLGVTGNDTWALPLGPVLADPVDLTESFDDQDAIDRVTMDRIWCRVSNNALDVPLQPTELRIGATNAAFIAMTEVATLPEIPAGTNGVFEGVINEKNQSAVSAQLTTLAFQIGFATAVEFGADQSSDGGLVDIRCGVDLSVRVFPLAFID